MAAGRCWRKAVVISLLLHGAVLTGIGWMAAKTFVAHNISEQYVELTLIENPVTMDEQSTPDTLIALGNQSVMDPTGKTNLAFTYKEQRAASTGIATQNRPAFSMGPGNHGTGEGVSVEQEGRGDVHSNGLGKGENGGSGAKQADRNSGLVAPSILSRLEPVYPEQARQAGQEGTVVLKIQILENGRAGYIAVYRSSGYDLLDDAAITAVRQWRFIPAKERESGQPVVRYITMPVVFRLNS